MQCPPCVGRGVQGVKNISWPIFTFLGSQVYVVCVLGKSKFFLRQKFFYQPMQCRVLLMFFTKYMGNSSFFPHRATKTCPNIQNMHSRLLFRHNTPSQNTRGENYHFNGCFLIIFVILTENIENFNENKLFFVLFWAEKRQFSAIER